jgi:periplasmic protein TonB
MNARAAWFGAAAASVAIHGALIAGLVPGRSEGGAPEAPAPIEVSGQSFEARASRIAAADAPEATLAATVPPETAVAAARPPGTVNAAPPVVAEPVAARSPTSATPMAPVIEAVRPVSATTAPTVAPAATERVAALQRVEEADATGAIAAPLVSPRPTPRPAATPMVRTEAPRRPVTPPAAEAPSQAAAPSAPAQAAASPRPAPPAAEPGDNGREAARYPERVNRHLGRLPRPSGGVRGEAVIGFSIAPGGGIGAIRVVRSSGDADFDQIAVSHVQRAAPFPPPPQGAQTQFAVTIRGR